MKTGNRLHILIYLVMVSLILNTTLYAGWVVEDNRPFTLRNTNGTTGDNIYGDFNVTGAPITCVTKSNGQCDWGYTGYLYSANSTLLTDIPTSKISLDSSSANLVIPSDATVTKAYLYWSGHIHGTTGTQAAYDAATAGYDSVILRTPDGTNHNVTATQVDRYAFMNNTTGTKGFRLMYQAMVDVTNIVQNGGYASNKQTFTVGNLKVTPGTDDYLYDPHIATNNVAWGPMGGWSLIVEYTRPIASGQKYKNVSIYDGFKPLTPNFGTFQSIDINVSGFLTPLSQIPTGTMAFYTMGSERQLTGEKVQISNKSGTMNNLTNSANLVGKQLNDTITINSALITSGRDFNPGIDLDTFEVSTSCKTNGGAVVACIDKNQTSTTLRLGIQAGNNSSDQSFPGMIALSLDIYTPDISAFRKDSNTSYNQQLHPGDSVQYTLDFNNSGTEAAKNITIYDTFSSTVGGDMLLNIIDRNATTLKNSLRLKSINEANYHCAIGSTDPACASLPRDANCSVDYANNNPAQATKLWCNIPYMAVSDRYLMQFSITVRSDYNQSAAEANVTNIAYSDYYNAETGEHVTVTGQSNINTAGTVGGAIPYGGLIDAVDFFDNTYSYNNLVGLKTKIAAKSNTQVTAVYLGSGPTYQPTIYSGSTYDMLVLFRLSDDACSQDKAISSGSGDVTATFVHNANQYSAVSNVFSMAANAKQIGRVKVHFIDWNKISFSSFQGNNCVQQSGITGNLKGVPQCLNGNKDKISPLFPNYNVSTCVTAVNGYDAACDSNAYNANGSKGNISPAQYNNTYGCLMCLSDAVNGTSNCSRDNFAIRPNSFQITSTSSHWPDLLTSALDYNTTIQALDAIGNLTVDYNVTGARSVFELNTTARYYPSGTLDTTGGLVGVYAMGANDFNMSNGISVQSSTGSNEVAPINFSDVGKMGLRVMDKLWAAVDNDDTSLDCSGTYICGDVNATFIPFDFNISIATVTNNRVPGSFTYMIRQGDPLSTLQTMSGRFNLTINAFNNNNAVTQNFRSGAWENPLSVTASVFDTVMGDANETSISNVLLGFGTGTDANGTKTLSWNESNTSKMLRFNYNMSPNVPINPFRIDGNETNITVSSHYTGAAAIAARDITGSRVQNADGNATFVYGRIIPKDIRVFGSSVQPVAYAWYEVYNAPIIAGVTLAPSKNESVWYSNTLHNDTTDGDANVTRLQQGTTSTSTNASSPSIGSGVETYTFTSQTPPYSAKAHIDTDSWLWYGVNALTYSDPSAANLDCMTHPCFNINVVPAMGVTGSAKSDATLNKSNKASSNSGLWHSTSDYAPAVR
ncbi:hypothetical protein [Sulfuricurvum sp.]|uniref:hypothetical protein n=1 Tax=Sulfuricurvum sp. TaxID=2025608 RepID=UPI0035620529